MAVECEDGDLRRIAGGLDTGDIAVSIQRQFNASRLMRLDVKTVHADLRIHLARHRILIRIESRIFHKFRFFRIHTLKQLQGVLLHVRLVVANPDDLLRVGREHHRRVCGELLLIHPVGYAVEHLVALAVLRHLTLRIVVEQLHQEDVIVSDERDLIAVGREDWRLLRTAVTQRLQFIIPDVIDIIDSRERTTVDGFCLCLYKNTATVWTHNIVVHLAHLSASGRSCIENDALLLASTEGIAYDLLAVSTDLRIGLTVCTGAHGSHRLLREFSLGDGLQVQLPTSKYR